MNAATGASRISYLLRWCRGLLLPLVIMGQRGKSSGNFKGGRGHRGRGRIHHRGRGRGRAECNRRPNYSKDNAVLCRPEQLSEVEVGITEYISTLTGFTAIVKARYSDFHVNEIDMDGNLAVLSDTKMPEEFKRVKLDIPESCPLQEIADDQWEDIKTLIEKEDDLLSVQVDVTSKDKGSRSLIHKTLKSIFRSKVISNTIEVDDKKFIQIKRCIGNNKQDRPDEWPASVPIYTHFLLYKEGADTMNAIMNLSETIHINSSAFNYAGVKDKRAKTTQWISCKKVEPSKLLYWTKRLGHIKIGNITFRDVPLSLGQLKGNLFRVALRDVKVEDDAINTHLEHLKEHGFINYYGLQRFGYDKAVPTHQIGIKLLQGCFRDACNLILKPRNCDNPSADITVAKKVYEATQNAQEAVKTLKANQSIESKLLFGLAKHGRNDFVNSLECIPRNMRLMYIHAFQGLIWNQVVSRRVKEFGFKPVTGDLVYLDQEAEAKNTLDDELMQEGKPNENKESNPNDVKDAEGEQLKGGVESDEEGIAERKKKLVKVLAEEDLPNYTIHDIVLPLPGYDVIYPENLKSFYRELLDKHDLQLEMPQQRVKCYTVSGNYRKIISKPAELKWHTIQYKAPHDTLILSDFEKQILKHEEPVSNPEGEFKGLVVSFKLESSSYATMLLREVLKIDTSPQFLARLNAPTVEKVEEVEKAEVENSLLNDKDKYDAFKKLIEESGDNEDCKPIKRSAVDEGSASKKAKVASDEEEQGIKIQPTLV